MTGIIENGKAKCEFDYGSDSDKGEIELSFINSTEIKVKVMFVNRKKHPLGLDISDGEYTFKPYTLEDVNELTKEKIHPVNLNLWGEVNITTGYINCNHPYAVAFITNNNREILYEFMGMTHGIEISSVIINDVNNDGLQDIKISLNTPETEKVEYIYIQMSNGLFYDSRLDTNPDISKLASLP